MLGIEAQRARVAQAAAARGAKLVGEFVGVESGRKADRPQLAAALAEARRRRALLVAGKVGRAEPLAGLGIKTRHGQPLSPSGVKLQLQLRRLGVAAV